MNLKVSENIYGQYVYIFSVDDQGKTKSSSSKGIPYGLGSSYNENHKLSNDGAYLKNASGEFHCTLEMILD